MKAVDVTCPNCGQSSIFLARRMIAKPIGDLGLAGGQVKFSVGELPVLFCSTSMAGQPWEDCQWELIGHFEDGHAVFDLPTSPEESSHSG